MKQTGDHNFAGQPARREGNAAPSEPDARVVKKDSSNKINGAGVSRRIVGNPTGANK